MALGPKQLMVAISVLVVLGGLLYIMRMKRDESYLKARETQRRQMLYGNKNVYRPSKPRAQQRASHFFGTSGNLLLHPPISAKLLQLAGSGRSY